ncbi:hypothetical protein ABK040_014348 [Willaertia magna]
MSLSDLMDCNGEVLIEHVINKYLVLNNFVDSFKIIKILRLTCKSMKILIDNYIECIYERYLFRIYKTLFKNLPVETLLMNNDVNIIKENDEEKLFIHFLIREWKTLNTKKDISDMEIKKDILIECLKTPFQSNCDKGLFFDFEGMGGSVDTSVFHPCQFLKIIFKHAYEHLSNSDVYFFHKYIILMHTLPVGSNLIPVGFTNESRSQRGSKCNYKVKEEEEEEKGWSLWSLLGFVGKIARGNTIQNILKDVEIKCRILNGELLLNMFDNFESLKQEFTIDLSMRTILYCNDYHNEFDYNLTMEDAWLFHKEHEFKPTTFYTDIFTMSSGSCYGVDPLLHTTYPELRKYLFDIVDNYIPGTLKYKHIWQYDWTNVMGSQGFDKLIANYWEYAIEYYTFSIFNSKKMTFVVLTSNPQD